MKNYLPIMALVACAAIFTIGIVELFELRFEAGDVYPPYSSLRADPLGTMAYYESLGKMPGINVRRDFSTENVMPEEPGTAYLHLAADPYEWEWLPEEDFHTLKNFLANGGRLVIAYFPETEPPYNYYNDEDDTNSIDAGHLKQPGIKEPVEKSSRKKKKLKQGEEATVNLYNEWGFHESYFELPQDGDSYAPVTVQNRTVPALPSSLDWHSGLIFSNCDEAWHTIYARGKHPVVMERSFGKGSVVLAGDSYFLSNEAMTRARHAQLLSWLIGSSTNVVFDEAHLGISQSPGIASLMRQYRLHGLAAGLLLLAGLFIWKNSTSLVPPHAEEVRDDSVAGKDSASGFINLLRRNIPRGDVFGVCYREWKNSSAPSGAVSSTRLQQAEAIFQAENSQPASKRNPLAAYRQISETLGNRRK